jgi:hypothetical protein
MIAAKLSMNMSRPRVIACRASSSDEVYKNIQAWVESRKKVLEKRRAEQTQLLKKLIDNEVSFAQEIVEMKKNRYDPVVSDDDDDEVYEPIVVEPTEKKS